MTQEREEKYTSEQLAAVLGQLSTDQIRFVVARQEYPTDKEAAEAIGISAQTVYRWPEEVKDAVRLMAIDGLVTASEVLRRNVAKAALVKAAGLDADDERLRQIVASDILDRMMGKPTQRSEVKAEHSGETVIRLTWGDNGDCDEDSAPEAT